MSQIPLLVGPLTKFGRQAFWGEARPVQFHAACQFPGTRRHLGLQTGAQHPDQEVYDG